MGFRCGAGDISRWIGDGKRRSGASTRIRTVDLAITNRSLYQLSYRGLREGNGNPPRAHSELKPGPKYAVTGRSGRATLLLRPEPVAQFSCRLDRSTRGAVAALAQQGLPANAVADFGDDPETEHDHHGDRPVGDALVPGKGYKAGQRNTDVAHSPEPELHCHIWGIGGPSRSGQCRAKETADQFAVLARPAA